MKIDKMDNLEPLGYMKYRKSYDAVGEITIGGLSVEIMTHVGCQRTKPYIKYEMVNNDKIIGEYSGKEFKHGIITSFAHTEPFVKGESIMYNFYEKYLLKKYSFIISDDSLSEAGFGFFYKNFDKFKGLGYKIFIYDEHHPNKEDKELSNKEELHKYYGDPLTKPLAGKQRYRIGKE